MVVAELSNWEARMNSSEVRRITVRVDTNYPLRGLEKLQVTIIKINNNSLISWEPVQTLYLEC